jgi:HAD superfamily hydrolase (TIGR01549 family)
MKTRPPGLDTVFLDAGGVLVFPNWRRISETLSRHGVSVSAARLEAADPHARHTIDVPGMIATTSDQSRGWHYFNLVLQHAGAPLTSDTDAALLELKAYHDTHNLWELVPADVPRSLGRLRSAGYRTAVVSNANGTLHAAFDRLGLTPLIDVVLDSAREGVEKPDPRLFEIALERTRSRADTTLHAGDIYNVDVVGARAAGLRAVLIDAGNLYPDADCPRYRSLSALVDVLAG